MAKDKAESNGEQRRPERPLSAFQRLIQKAMGDNRTMGLETDPLRSSCPELWEILSTVYVGRDKIVTPGRVNIQLGPEGALVQLVARDIAHSISISCPHMEQWAIGLEAALSGPNPPWVPWGRKEPHLKKRKSEN